MPTATRTVLFTDLADYTGRVSRADREGLRRILSEHESIVRPLVEAVGGRIVKNIGDSFLCVFGSATDALAAALDIFADGKASGGVDIRIGLSTGDVEEIDGDVFGSAVNVAARILDLTPAGECWFGQGTRVCMNETEVPWETVGSFSLKGIPQDQECYRLVPSDRVWLPRHLEEAIELKSLVRLGPGERPPRMPADPIILLEGFEPGSKELKSTMATLPVLEPQAFYLAAYGLATVDRHEWLAAGHGLIVGTQQAIDKAIVDALDIIKTHSADTFSLDPAETMMLTRAGSADLELAICGLALPAAPFSDIVASYAYDLLDDGRWVTRSRKALIRVTVDPDGVHVTALQPDVAVGGAGLAPGSSQTLDGATHIDTPVGRFEYMPTNRYAGMLLHDTDMRLAVRRGQIAELGRNPGSPGLAFPARPGQENIQWCSGQRADKARDNGFTLDRVLAGRQQAAVGMDGDAMRLTPLHSECPTFVLRDGKLGQAKGAVRVGFGDMVVAGTNVVSLRRPE